MPACRVRSSMAIGPGCHPSLTLVCFLVPTHTLFPCLQSRVGGGANSSQPFSLKLLMRGLPWMAVASAGMANAVAMRYKEAVDGITGEARSCAHGVVDDARLAAATATLPLTVDRGTSPPRSALQSTIRLAMPWAPPSRQAGHRCCKWR